MESFLSHGFPVTTILIRCLHCNPLENIDRNIIGFPPYYLIPLEYVFLPKIMLIQQFYLWGQRKIYREINGWRKKVLVRLITQMKQTRNTQSITVHWLPCDTDTKSPLPCDTDTKSPHITTFPTHVTLLILWTHCHASTSDGQRGLLHDKNISLYICYVICMTFWIKYVLLG